MSEVWQGFYLSRGASGMCAVLFAPRAAKTRSLSASVRPVPPTQIGRRRSRSLTPMRESCPFWMAISSTPIARGAGRPAGEGNLLQPVDRVEVRDRAVVEALRHGHRGVRPLAAECAHMHRKALGETRVRRQPVEARGEHATAPRAVDPKPLELEVDAEPAGREVAGTAGACVVATAALVATRRADRRFFSARQHQHPGGAVPKDAEEPGGGDEARQRAEGTT